MAWDDEMPAMIRAILQDEGETPTYGDDGLIRIILTSAMKLLTKLKFRNDYAVSFDNETIKPDPAATANRDDWFIVLVCHQAVVTLVKSEIRSMTRQGITIQDGDSRISLQRSPEALKAMLKAYEDDFQKLLYDFETGAAEGGVGEVIVSPYPIFSDIGEYRDRRRFGAY